MWLLLAPVALMAYFGWLEWKASRQEHDHWQEASCDGVHHTYDEFASGEWRCIGCGEERP